MRKSVIIGLLLLTAGLFGVATTLNIISHAMAQGYDDNYHGDASYSTHPTDDKKYECRTGAFEGFFVSSVEVCKHIKFDKFDKDRENITGTQGPPGPQGPPGGPGGAGPEGERGFTGLTGPTGPASTVPGLQGPIGTNGTQGPQGIQGPIGPNGTQGPQGIQGERGFNGTDGVNGTQGPPGITQLIPGTNVYLVTNSSGFVNINTTIKVQALCQPRDFVIDGGYNYDYTTFTQFLFIGKSQPIISPSGAGWEASLFDSPTGRGNLIVYAYCFDNSP